MSITDQIKAYLPSLNTIADVALSIAKVMPGSSAVADAVELGIKVANGIANEVPVVLETWKDIQTAAAGGAPVSEDEWKVWQASVDQAHTAFRASLARVESQS